MCRIEAGMHTITTLIAIFVIVTAIALVTSGSFTASTLAVKKKSTVTTKKSTGSKKTKTLRHTGTGSSGSTGGTSSGSTLGGGGGKGISTLGGTSSGSSGTAGGTDPFSKFISCMRLSAGPLTRAGVDQCYNIVYGTSSTSSSVGSPPHMGPSGNVAPTLGTP
jgi:hypothetical protein